MNSDVERDWQAATLADEIRAVLNGDTIGRGAASDAITQLLTMPRRVEDLDAPGAPVTGPVMTAKQADLVSYLAKTKQREDCPVAANVTAIVAGVPTSRRDASTVIDVLQGCPMRPTPPADVPDEGYYLRDGIVYVVVPNRAGNGSYAERMVVDPDTRRDRWVYAPCVGRALAREGFEPLTPEQGATLSRQHGCCLICGRTLTDPTSVFWGVGPVCAKTIGESYARLTDAQ